MIKTVEQYLESLNDGKQIWCLGEKVSDVRTHPIWHDGLTDFIDRH